METNKKSGANKAVGALVVGAMLCGGAYIGYKKYEGEHFLVAGSAAYLKSVTKVPSSTKVTEASFYLSDGQIFNGGKHDNVPTVMLKFESMNAYGTPMGGTLVLYLGIKGTGGPKDNPKLVEAWQRNYLDSNERIRNGKVVTPFENLGVQAAYVNGMELSETNLLLLRTEIGKAKQGYSGPALGGRVREYRPLASDVDCTFDKGFVTYTPGKIIPYSK